MKINRWIGASLLALSVAGSNQAFAQEDFYAGKSISLVIGSGEAGVYDLGARIMARYLKKYVPGAPNVVPRNMPGASSVVAAEYVYNVAAPDGLTLLTVQPTVVLNKSLDPAAKYKSERFSWIGRMQPVVLGGISWTKSPLKTIEDAKARSSIVSASGASGTSAIVPWALNKLIGTKFQVVRGYPSQRPQFLAMERGEVEGIGSASLSDVITNRDWMDNKRVSILYTISQSRTKMAPDAPAIVEFATNDTDRKVLAMLGSVSDIGQTLLGPPGLPAAQLSILRKSFLEMMKDPELIEEAKRIAIYVDPLSGEDLQTLVTAAADVPNEIVEKLRAVTRPQ